MVALLALNETDLVGSWVSENGRVVGDAVEQRINALISGLVQIDQDVSGWDTLYRDPRDGRYWELTYPQSDLHGGGPKRLTCLSQSAAASKYHLEGTQP